MFFLFLVVVLYRGFSKKNYDGSFRLETKTPKKIRGFLKVFFFVKLKLFDACYADVFKFCRIRSFIACGYVSVL